MASFASRFCSLVSFTNPSVDYKSEARTNSDASRRSSSTKFSTSIREELSNSRKVNPSFMRNYTLLESIQLMPIIPQIAKDENSQKSDFPVKHFACHSHRGFSLLNSDKKNQDSLITFQHEGTKSLVLACLDGHGFYGDVVSQYIAGGLEHRLGSHESFLCDVRTAITDTITAVEATMFVDEDVDCSLSGTTLTLAVMRGTTVTVANVGDSRTAIITKLPDGTFKLVPLTFDHTPNLENERERILRNGGRVFGVRYPDGTTGPERVWLGSIDAPGLAMSRSVGDKAVHNVGVISTPDFVEKEISSDDVAIVIASDGLWNVLSDVEVVKHVMSSRDAAGAVGLLLREARIRWLSSGNRDSADDTSVILAFFHGR